MPKYRYTAAGVVHARSRKALMLHLILSMRADRWGASGGMEHVGLFIHYIASSRNK